MGRNYFSKNNIHAGFTLIELLVAITIIGVLASSLFFVFNPAEQFMKGRDAQRKNDLEQTRNALDTYYSDYNSYPKATDSKINGANWGSTWQPYMQKIPKDPTASQSYLYEAASDGSWYRLYAKLERCSDPQIIPGIDCATNYNYSVTSTNTSVVAFPTPTPTPIPKRVFVSSSTYKGDFGGLSGGDAQCQALANGVTLGGTWKAWLSSNNISAQSRLSHAIVPYRLIDGTLIANNWSDLTDGSIANPINKDQNGILQPARSIWTNTNINGNVDGSNTHCTQWSSTFGFGRVGDSSSTSSSTSFWTTRFLSSCNIARALYCFEQ